MPADGAGESKGLNVSGMAVEWERDEHIRAHLREEDSLLFPLDMSECIKTACYPYVHGFLKPLLIKMAEADGRPQPFVDPLREEVSKLYQMFSEKIPDTQVVHDSWMTRKFLGLVKMKARKQQPSTDLWLCTQDICFLSLVSGIVLNKCIEVIYLDKQTRLSEPVFSHSPLRTRGSKSWC